MSILGFLPLVCNKSHKICEWSAVDYMISIWWTFVTYLHISFTGIRPNACVSSYRWCSPFSWRGYGVTKIWLWIIDLTSGGKRTSPTICQTMSRSMVTLCSQIALRWRHNELDGVSDHQPHGCLLNRLFRRWSKKTSKLRVTGLCVGNSPGPVNSPHKGPVTRNMLPFDDVIMVSRLVTCDAGYSIDIMDLIVCSGAGEVCRFYPRHPWAFGLSVCLHWLFLHRPIQALRSELCHSCWASWEIYKHTQYSAVPL